MTASRLAPMNDTATTTAFDEASVPAEATTAANTDGGTELPADQGNMPGTASGTNADRARNGRNNGKQGGRHGGRAPAQQAPNTRRPHPALEKLFELYPLLFGARFLPLKLGVFQELMARHPDAFAKDELKVAMGLHARSTRYLESVAAGHPRHDLDGQPVEPVAPEHVHHAIMELHRRRQLRSPNNDLSGELRTRLARAIDESGLSREAYAERTRTQDERHNALLDEALAEQAGIAARREALLRAFEASGKTEAEFADMYGMDAKEAARVLKRARVSVPAAMSAAAATEPASASTATATSTENASAADAASGSGAAAAEP